METRIYVTDLAAYNNGMLIGRWLDLPLSEDELAQETRDILREGESACGYGETHEELFITDSEGFDDFYRVDEYDSIDKLNDMAYFLLDLDEWDGKKLQVLLRDGYDFDEIQKNGVGSYDVELYDFSNSFNPWDNLVELFIDDGLFGDIPEYIRFYLDTELMARDLKTDYDEYNGIIYRIN